MQGKHFQVDKEPLLAIPICVPPEATQREVAELVKRIIEGGTHLLKARTSAEQEQLHRLIDQWDATIQQKIESIYGLTDDEIVTVSVAGI